MITKTKAAAAAEKVPNTKLSNKNCQKKDDAWKKIPPAQKRPKPRRLGPRISIGVFTTWRGPSTALKNAAIILVLLPVHLLPAPPQQQLSRPCPPKPF